jgi:cytochrome c oxidase cbb3-type subunit 3
MSENAPKPFGRDTDVATTGHEWDGIREYDNPLPRWWQWVFYACVVWSIGYWIAMPAWPTLTGYTRGLLGYSSRQVLRDDISAAQAAQGDLRQKFDAASLEQIRTDPALLEFAIAGGRSAFSVNCTQCHGSGAAGNVGYPNLNDDEWLWGGTLEQIAFTIRHGARNEVDDDAHASQMPAFLKDGILNRQQVADVAEHVLQLAHKDFDLKAAERGAQIFKDNCVACHGATGAGNIEVGAPALNNDIWLYGGDRQAIVATISNARRGVMPAWGKIIDDTTIKELAVYVHSLGGGK